MGKWKRRVKELEQANLDFAAAINELWDIVGNEPGDCGLGERYLPTIMRSRMIELQQLRVLRLRQNVENWGEVAGSVLGPMLGPMIPEPEARVCSGEALMLETSRRCTWWCVDFPNSRPCATMTGCVGQMRVWGLFAGFDANDRHTKRCGAT